MTDILNPYDILPQAEKTARRPLLRRTTSVRSTESLRASLDRVADKLGLPVDAGVTAHSLELGLTFKRARLAKGLTQEELARGIGLSQTALSMIENGRGPDGPTWATVLRICEALSIEPSFLPADPHSLVSEVGEVRFLKASTSANARVREAGLGEEAAAVAVGLLSKEKLKWLKLTLNKFGLGSSKPVKMPTSSRFLSLAPHTGTRIRAIENALVVIAVDGGRVGVRAAAQKHGVGKTWINDGIALVDKAGVVEVGNTSDQSSVVFALPVTQLIANKETVSS